MTSARVSAVMPRTVQPLRSGLCRGLSGLLEPLLSLNLGSKHDARTRFRVGPRVVVT